MKKTISRMLALLTALILLMSAMCPALASAVQELGSIEDVEQMLFDAVVEIFPTSAVEQQYIYAAYYEQKGQTENVDALMETLSEEQRVLFINYKLEHTDCIEGCEGENCTVDNCACICHEVEAFNTAMDDLIVKLLAMDMQAVLEYIADLRLEEMRDYWAEQFVPVPTAGTGGYEASLASVPETFALETASVGAEEQYSAQDVADAYNELVENADADALNNTVKESVDEAVAANVLAEASMIEAYGEDSSSDSYLSATGEDAALSQLNLMRSYVMSDMQTFSAMYTSTTSSSGMTTSDAAEGVDSSNIKIRLTNFDGNINNSHDLKFFHSQTYAYDTTNNKYKTVDGITGSHPEDGYQEESFQPVQMAKTLVDGYPMDEGEGGVGSLNYLFNGSEGESFETTGNGLFWKEEDYYVYDSAQRAAFWTSSGFQLYNEIVRPWYTAQTSNEIQVGNFLPFDSAEDETDVVQSTTDKNEGNNRYVIKEPDLWFSMTMEMDFYMPKDGYVSGEEMEFDFHGDDDVWVYIDDVLILNIGKTHGAESGKINFADGMVTDPTGTSTIKSLFEEAGKYNAEGFNRYTFADYTKHKLKFFYMERGGNISYCRLKFNMPQLPDGALSVKKEIEGDITALTNESYSFTIKDANGKPVTGEDATYVVTGVDGTEAEAVEAKNGVFSIKAGETATFTHLPADANYTVTETSGLYTESTEWIINDSKEDTPGSSTTAEASVYIAPEQTAGAMMVATNTLKTTSLKVEKEVVNPRPVDEDNVYTFEASVKYGLDGTTPLTAIKDSNNKSYSVVDGKFSFTLEEDESITFVDLPIGATVTITETDTAGNVIIDDFKTEILASNVKNNGELIYTTKTESDDHSITGIIGTAADGTAANSTVTFTNTPKIYDLKITKQGLENGVDGAQNLEPYSSTMYSVVCEATGVDMTVAIYGNSSVTINDLPVGTYTVTELTDWSWRYSSTNDKSGQVLLDGTDDNIAFTNTRVYDKWLDSDCYAENTFDGSSDADRRPTETN